MHILFLASYYPNRVRKTVGNFIQRHAEAIGKKFNITVLAIERDNSMAKRYEITWVKKENYSVCMIYCRDIQSTFPLLSIILNFLNSFKALICALKLIKKKKGDFNFVHLNVCYSLGLLAIYLKFFYKKKYVLTEHSSIFLNDNIRTLPSHKVFLIRCIFKFATSLSTVSDYLGRSIVRMGLSKTYSVIPNIVPANLFLTASKPKRKKMSFVHISNLVPLKGCEQMIHACRRLFIRNINFKFIIVGGGGTELNSLKLLSKKLHLEHLIEFTGEVDASKVANYMRHSDFLLMNSEFETFCLVMMEAMSCGIPIVAPNNTVFTENINSERGILMVDRSEESIEIAILDMINKLPNFDPIKIREYVENKFTEESVANKFLELYRSSNLII